MLQLDEPLREPFRFNFLFSFSILESFASLELLRDLSNLDSFYLHALINDATRCFEASQHGSYCILTSICIKIMIVTRCSDCGFYPLSPFVQISPTYKIYPTRHLTDIYTHVLGTSRLAHLSLRTAVIRQFESIHLTLSKTFANVFNGTEGKIDARDRIL